MAFAETQKVVLAFPHPHEVSARFSKSLMFLLAYDMSPKGPRRIAGFLPNSSGANITNARNEIVKDFLERDLDWLLFIDTDMTFEPDLVERLIRAAHPEKRPILGALCFSLQNGNEASPTIYTFREDGRLGRIFDYPRDQLIQPAATGTGCLLIHRSVFEKMRGKFSPAYPWFQETHVKDLPVGEDITFCIRAGSMEIPTFVDTSIKCGHEKPFIVDEAMFDAQQTARRVQPTAEPTYVVVPTRDGEARAAENTIWIPNDGPLNLSAKWNHGLDWAEKVAREAGHDAWQVAILNDDLDLGPDCLELLANAIRRSPDVWIAYPNVHGLELKVGELVATASDAPAGQTMSGYCFMIRGEVGLRCDEQFRWWYGDSDLERQVREAGKQTVCVGGAHVNHLNPMKSTAENPELLALAKEDEGRFAAKWGLDPGSLWLAQHPTWP